MRTLLRAEFLNGQFGDPALYIWDLQSGGALLLDCGDISRFTTKQLLKASHIFISHCHVDHFFGFDHFLRVHIGSERSITVFGPPKTSERVGGKLQGYTWNLIHDQRLEFKVVDLDPIHGKKRTVFFRARDGFRADSPHVEDWDPAEPVHDAGIYQVTTTLLDHHTPCLAYAIEEKPMVHVDIEAMRELGLEPGSWIGELKHHFLFGGLDTAWTEVSLRSGQSRRFRATELAQKLLAPTQRHKIAYSTDGAAHTRNHKALLELIEGADQYFSETCFVEADRVLADRTRHFTAAFIGDLAREAAVRTLAPFHFSKRYLGRPERVMNELAAHFQGEIVSLSAAERVLTL